MFACLSLPWNLSRNSIVYRWVSAKNAFIHCENIGVFLSLTHWYEITAWHIHMTPYLHQMEYTHVFSIKLVLTQKLKDQFYRYLSPLIARFLGPTRGPNSWVNMGPIWVLSAPDGPHVNPWILLSGTLIIVFVIMPPTAPDIISTHYIFCPDTLRWCHLHHKVMVL